MSCVVLASQSPRRKELLAQMGIEFLTQVADIDETRQEGESVEHFVLRMAEEKAAAVAKLCPQECWIIAGDTVVELNDEVLGKPKTPDVALEMLQKLSGKTHRVLTSIAVQHNGVVRSSVSSTEVTFKPLEASELKAYLETDETFDKAGGYGIQGTAAKWVSNLNGNYFAVMGLPIFELNALLDTMGFFAKGSADA